MKKSKKIVAIFLLLSLFFAANPMVMGSAQAADGKEIGMWVGAGFCSLLYTPIKLAFALLMGIGGGLSMIGTVPTDNVEVSSQIIRWGMYGDWLVRPDHLTDPAFPGFVGFDDEFHFISEKIDFEVPKWSEEESTFLAQGAKERISKEN